MEDDVQAGSLVDAAEARREAARPNVEGLIDWGHALYEEGRYDEAAKAFEFVLGVEDGNWRALIGRNRAIRRSVPRWHWEMLHDELRSELYDKAIRHIVSPQHLVLDVGAGSGLLSMMAARAGARQVVACEAQHPVAEVARRVISKAGHDDVITVVPKMSTRMRVPGDLPRRADVLVTETVDCALLGEGILPTITHAREHLLTDDAIILPCGGRVFAQLVESPSLYRKNHVGQLYGFDLTEFNQLSSIEYFDSRLRHHEHRMLSEPIEVFRFDFYRDTAEPRRAEFVVPPSVAGTCHAVVFWFELDLVPGLSLANSPSTPNTHWKQAIQCLPVPIHVQPDEPLLLDARHDGVNIHFTAVASGVRTLTDGAAE
ncbi:50S ribosomal protein L11 methyltransferase [Actinoallomurus acaciae]|uniref:50S ribosomal protein L11 methyltransferase n=1 Tax=Actinoallomurus acaciae TaxID=502577 RepID=A0ABV5Y9W8_9ACTN